MASLPSNIRSRNVLWEVKESWRFQSTKDFCVENIGNMGKPQEVSQIYITKKASKNDWKSEHKMLKKTAIIQSVMHIFILL